MGVPCLKCPMDLWPTRRSSSRRGRELVVETGTHAGGSALFLAHMLDLLGEGEVVTIDVLDRPGRPAHPRIRYVTGSSGDVALVAGVFQGRRPDGEPRLVILDSDHSQAHVLRELELFAPRVSVGNYLVVEDTNVNGHPVLSDFGPGPQEAIDDFLARTRVRGRSFPREVSDDVQSGRIS